MMAVNFEWRMLWQDHEPFMRHDESHEGPNLELSLSRILFM